VDLVSIGVAVALLAGKKTLERAGEKIGEEAGEAGWNLGNKILDKVRSLFSLTDKAAKAQLEEIEHTVDPTDEQVNELGAKVSKYLVVAPDLVSELGPLIEAAQKDLLLGPLLAGIDSEAKKASGIIIQSISGDSSGGSIQIGTAGGDVRIDRTNTPEPS